MKFDMSILNKYIVVEDGLISNPDWGEGRLIPAVIVSSKKDTKLKELLKIHKDFSSGDVIIQWGKFLSNLLRKEKIFLQVTFLKPQKATFQIEFNVQNQYTLIEAIFKSRGVYIDVGKKGDKVSRRITSKESEFILVEVGDTNLDKWWNKKLYKIIYKKMKKKQIPKKFIHAAVKDYLSEMEEILDIRRGI